MTTTRPRPRAASRTCAWRRPPTPRRRSSRCWPTRRAARSRCGRPSSGRWRRRRGCHWWRVGRAGDDVRWCRRHGAICCRRAGPWRQGSGRRSRRRT